MSKELYQIIKRVVDTKGSNAKLDILRNLSPEQNDLVKNYLSRVYSGDNWYQTKLPSPAGRLSVLGKPLITVIEAIDQFKAGERRGDKGAQRLSVLSALLSSDEERELLKFAIWKDVKAGIGPKTINKIWPNLIFIPPYQRCSTLDKKYHQRWDWSKGIFVQNKEDQMFGNLTRKGLFTRNYNLIESKSIRELNDWIASVEKEFCQQLVFHGEIQVKDASGSYVTREKSNGLINGLIQTGEELPEGFTVNMTLWNVLDEFDFYKGESKYKYETSFKFLQEILESIPCDRLRIVRNERVTNMKEVARIFRDVLIAKGEGLVIKDPCGTWSDDDGGSEGQVKVKIEMEVDLKIVGFNAADSKSKYHNLFASLQCESEDRNIITGVSGMTEEMRTKIWENRDFYEGKVVTIQCNGLQWNNQVPHSLYYAQFVEVREDKQTSDNLEDIISIQDAAVEACLMSKN